MYATSTMLVSSVFLSTTFPALTAATPVRIELNQTVNTRIETAAVIHLSSLVKVPEPPRVRTLAPQKWLEQPECEEWLNDEVAKRKGHVFAIANTSNIIENTNTTSIHEIISTRLGGRITSEIPPWAEQFDDWARRRPDQLLTYKSGQEEWGIDGSLPADEHGPGNATVATLIDGEEWGPQAYRCNKQGKMCCGFSWLFFFSLRCCLKHCM